MKQVFVAAVGVLGAIGFSSVAMAAGRGSSPQADGAAEPRALPKNPHAVHEGVKATVRATQSNIHQGARASSASSFSTSRSARTR